MEANQVEIEQYQEQIKSKNVEISKLKEEKDKFISINKDIKF